MTSQLKKIVSGFYVVLREDVHTSCKKPIFTQDGHGIGDKQGGVYEIA